MNRFLLPLSIFIVVVGFLGVGLKLNPREIPSPLVGKSRAEFLPAPPLRSRESVFAGRPQGESVVAQFLGILVQWVSD